MFLVPYGWCADSAYVRSFFSSRRRHTRFDCDYSSDGFFFSSRRRHTRFDCDWSSDVCSSDLKRGVDTAPAAAKAVDFRARHSHPDFRITCIGVWDTVGALGIPVGLCGRLSRRLFGFHDVTLSSRVDRAFHAIAVDERRRPFVPTLWHQQPDASKAGQVLEQVWFTGVHSDVGGGYGWDERDLANLTLRWMANRVT